MSRRPRFLLRSRLNDLALTVNPLIYHRLVTIRSVFDLDSKILEMLKTDKQKALKSAVKSDTLFCRTAENDWHQRYVLLSGAYLYIYEKNVQSSPSAYYYIVNAVVHECPHSDQDKLHFFTARLGIHGFRSRTSTRPCRSAPNSPSSAMSGWPCFGATLPPFLSSLNPKFTLAPTPKFSLFAQLM